MSWFRGLSLVHMPYFLKEVKEITGLPDYFFTSDKLEAYKDANLLKGGLVYADAITTVSDTYAEEIKTAFYGEGLDGLMRARAADLRGIVNGVDYTDFSPEVDQNIEPKSSLAVFQLLCFVAVFHLYHSDWLRIYHVVQTGLELAIFLSSGLRSG